MPVPRPVVVVREALPHARVVVLADRSADEDRRTPRRLQNRIVLGVAVTAPRATQLAALILAGAAACKGAADGAARAPTASATAPSVSSARTEPEAAASPTDAAALARDLDSARVGALELTVEGCRLSSSATRESVDVVPGRTGCRFVRDRSGRLHTVTTNAGPVVLVETARPSTAPHARPNDCDTAIRGVVVSGRDVLLSRQTQRVAACPSFGWDEKMFHVFAAATEPAFPQGPSNSAPRPPVRR